jgi:hypothetical protein
VGTVNPYHAFDGLRLFGEAAGVIPSRGEELYTSLAIAAKPRRRHTPSSEQRRWVWVCERSDSTQEAFAQAHGLKLGTLRDWIRRHGTNVVPSSQKPGIEIPRNTMVSWVEQSAALLIAVYRAMKAMLRKKGYLQVDETPVRYLEQGARGQSKRGYMWVYLAPAGEVILQWSTGRAAAAPEAFLGPEFHGTIQSDGYSAYTALRNQNPGRVELAHCWAHARRAIYEASPEAPRTAAWLLGQIQALYAVEKRLREATAGPALRAAIRWANGAQIAPPRPLRYPSHPIPQRVRKRYSVDRMR